MRLVTFRRDRQARIGVLTDNDTVIVDLSLADRTLPRDMTGFIIAGKKARRGAARAVKTAKPKAKIPAKRAKILAPIPVPARNILCVGRNYHEHAKEFHDSGFDATSAKTAIPDYPIIFTKAPSSVIATGEPIPAYLDPTKSVDYETELGVVIGKGGRGISKKDAYDHVYGYTIINDVTARHLQNRHRQWFIGKSLDGFCPMGPILVTADEIGDVRKLRLTCHINGAPRQNARIKDLIFDIPTLIKTLAAGITLQPGDIIATGTPVGVGIGFNPPIFLKKGDVVRMAIDKLGVLENPVA